MRSSGCLDQAAVDDVVHARDVGHSPGGQQRDQCVPGEFGAGVLGVMSLAFGGPQKEAMSFGSHGGDVVVTWRTECAAERIWSAISAGCEIATACDAAISSV